MIKSMTAFARIEQQADFGNLVWELRSVNHRYLETSIRLPENMRSLEQVIKEKISKSLKRGKIDCNLRVKYENNINTDIQIDTALAEQLINTSHELGKNVKSLAPLNTFDVLNWPGVIKSNEIDIAPIQKAVLSALDEALESLVDTRAREGEQTLHMLEKRCQFIADTVVKVRARRPVVQQHIKEKVLTKLKELEAMPDQNRIEQELVFLAQKMDVDEELDRLDTHITEVINVLKRDEPVGRRLDFLMQEFNREANTLSSKSGDVETTQAAVDLKVAIEQMREQVQNIE